LKVIDTALRGVKIIEPRVFEDSRGFFVETYQFDRYRHVVGSETSFVQDNHSRSTRGVLRGVHAQREHPQGKLVRCTRGEVFDVAVDIDPSSSTFGVWAGVVLSDTNHKQFWVPPGFAHGFVVLSETADFEYKCTDYYHADDEIGVIWDDPDVGIEWPIGSPTLSDKDRKLPSLAQIRLGQ
jgi:dTDP-4-dehydrorhamnose 3,5-epimerase